jgi:PAS domain S-box-containing protein
MDKRLLTPGALFSFLFSGLLLLGLFLTSRYSYLLFHTISGFFSVLIAAGVFAIAWNSRRFQENSYLLFLGIAYLFVGGLDFLYTLTYQALGIFPALSHQVPGQLWLAARTLESLSLFLAPQFIGRRLRPFAVLAAYLLAFSVTVLIILVAPHPLELPASGPVLTALQKTVQYVNPVLLLGAMALLWLGRKEFDPSVLRLLLGGITLALGSEITLSFLARASTAAGLTGHLFRIASLYLIYRALIAAELIKPYQRLSHSLKVSGDLIRHEKDFADRLIEIAQEIILVLDGDGRILRLNHRCEALTGYTLADVKDRPFWEIFPAPEEVAEVQEAFFDLIAGDFTQSWQLEWLAKDGTRRLISWSNTAFPRENGSVEYVIGTGIDISEQREVKECLQRLNGKLAQQIEVPEKPAPQPQLPVPQRKPPEFTSTAFHNFEVPLRWLKGYCQALEEHAALRLDLKGRDYLQRMQGIIGQMEDLIETLRQDAQLAQTELVPQEINLSAQARSIAANLQRRAPGRPVQFIIAKSLTAVGDPTLLYAALQNLLANAWKFTENLPQTTIEFGTLPPKNGYQVFFLRDNRNASGIHHVNKLFRSFQHMHPARAFSGSEVSLATARRLILRHGGRIWAEGRVGQGVTFFFTIPQASRE